MATDSYAELAAQANDQGKIVVLNADGTYSIQDPPPPTLDEIQKQFTDAIQGRLDAFAQTRGYDGILSAASYATSTIPQFRAEGQYAVEARDLTWANGYEILGAVLAGERPMPTIEEVFAELPDLAWPEAADA